MTRLAKILAAGAATLALAAPAYAGEPPVTDETTTTTTDSYTTTDTQTATDAPVYGSEGAVIASEPNQDVAGDVETYGYDDGVVDQDEDAAEGDEAEDELSEDFTSDDMDDDMGEGDWPTDSDDSMTSDEDTDADPLD